MIAPDVLPVAPAEPTTPMAPVEPTTPMKPSEAMRLGIMVTGPARYHNFGYDNTACALGAMAIGYGADPNASYDDWDHHPAFVLYGRTSPARLAATLILPYRPGTIPLNVVPDSQWPTACPAHCREASDGSVATPLIPHLNDQHKWPRTKIADWLEGMGL